MAKVTKIIDDIDGSDATDTLEFSWGADDYTIDLNDKNAQEFREFMALYIGHATKKAPQVYGAGRSGSGGTSGLPKRSTEELTAIREWANANGHTVSLVGRIPNKVIEAFDAATTVEESEE